LRNVINNPANQSPKAALDALEAAYQNRYQDWLTNGATGPPPVRDETKFATAENAVRKAETRMADATTANQTLQAKFQTLAEDLQTVGSTTTDLIQQIQLEESNRLFQNLSDTEARRASIRAQILALAMVLGPALARNNSDNGRLIGAVNNLRVRLETFPPEPTDSQCQTARQAWNKFEQSLRTDPQATYKEE
jgi:Skp family chaperone for outer membrane proteins